MLRKDLFAHKVVGIARQVVFDVLLSVLCQTSQMSILLIGIRVQDDIQVFFAQAVLSHCAKHYHPRCTVPLLLNGYFTTIKDQGNQCAALAQIQGGAEKFLRTRVSGLCGNLGRWRKEGTLLEFTRMPFELYRSVGPESYAPLADNGEASTASPSVSQSVSLPLASPCFERFGLS